MRLNAATSTSRFVIVCLLIFAMCSQAAPAAGVGVGVGPGVDYFRLNDDFTPGMSVAVSDNPDAAQAVHVLRISRVNPYVELRASLGRGQVHGIETVLTQALRQHAPNDASDHAPGETVVAAVNADFFASAPVSGLPIGLHMQGEELVTSPAGRPAFGVQKNGRPVIGVPVLNGTVWREGATPRIVGRMNGNNASSTAQNDAFPDEAFPNEDDLFMMADIGAVNRPQQGLTATMYTPRFGAETSPLEGTVVTVRGIVEPLRPGVVYTGIVSRIETARPSASLRAAIPDDGVVFVARGIAQVMLDELAIGEWVHFALELAPPFADVVDAVAGWPVLLQGAERQPLPAHDPLVSGRHPRTAMGFNDDEVFIVTADGRQPGYADGMNLFELTDLLIELGATDAINLDGGGSTTFVVRPPGAPQPVVANVPSDGHERSVANALLVVSTAPPSTLTTLHVQPTAPAVLRGATVPVHVAGQDRHNNPITIASEAVHWESDTHPGAAQVQPNDGSVDLVGAAAFGIPTFADRPSDSGAGSRNSAETSTGAAAFVSTSASAVPHTVRLTATVGRVQGTAAIDIVDTVASLQPASEIVNIAAGESAPLIMHASDTAGRRIWIEPQQLQWSVESGNGVIVTVDTFGRVTGLAAGEATVHARFGGAVAAIRVFVDKPPLLVADFGTATTTDEWFANVARAQAQLSRTAPPEALRQGHSSLRLVYDLGVNPGGTAAAYVQAAEPIPIPERPEAIGLWVYGNNSGHWLRGNYIDGTGTRQVFDFTAVGGLDWMGWRFVTAPIPPDTVLPISLERIYVVEMHRERQTKGELYFDRLLALYESR